jgi:putative nucleotidyltransferase with HDIG domain
MNPEWRNVAKSAAYEAAISEVKDYNGNPDLSFNYRWEHIKAVVNLAYKLANMINVDTEVVEAAAWLHDIAKTNGRDHAELGARKARSLLENTTFPENKIRSVERAIAQHKGLWRDEQLVDPAAMVLWDADKLSKIGLTAVIHWTAMFLAADRPMTSLDLISKGKDAAWQVKTVASMHTEPAQRAAAARFKAYNAFWSELEAELKGDDLDVGGKLPIGSDG